MEWINGRVGFPKRRATLLVCDAELGADFFTFARAGDFARLEALCLALCNHLGDGRYRHATLHSLTFDASRWCWCLGFAHPALEAVGPAMRAPELLLDALDPTTVALLRYQARGATPVLEARGDAVAQREGHDAAGGGLDEPDEQP